MPFGVVDCAWSNAVTGRPRISFKRPCKPASSDSSPDTSCSSYFDVSEEDYVTAGVQISAHVLIDREDSVYQNEDIVEDTVEDC